MVEVEGSAGIVSTYATGEAQHDSVLKVSMRPFMRKQVILSVHHTSFYLMDLGFSGKCSSSKWPRIWKNASDFTESGKTCLLRLQEQAKSRLPQLKPHQMVVVFLDQTTKTFAKNVFETPEEYAKAKEELLVMHLEVYRALHDERKDFRKSGSVDLADVAKLDSLLQPTVKDEKDDGVKKEGNADVDDKEGFF